MIERESGVEVLTKRRPIVLANREGEKRIGYVCSQGVVMVGEDLRDGNNLISSGRSLIITNDGGLSRPYLVTNKCVLDVWTSLSRGSLAGCNIPDSPNNRMTLKIGEGYSGFMQLPTVVGFIQDGAGAVRDPDMPVINDPFEEVLDTLEPLWRRANTTARNRVSLHGKLRTITSVQDIQTGGYL